VDEEDLRLQLIQKEKDLILAAELGKALLEKNEELNEANEKMAEEFSRRLEVRKIVYSEAREAGSSKMELRRSWGRCYDLRFLPIFCEKNGVFLKNQYYDQIFGKN
jgi:hypothetical protein